MTISNKRTDYQILVASEARGHVGGGYFNPIEEFVRIARPLSSTTLISLCDVSLLTADSEASDSYFVASLFSEICRLVEPTELAFGLYDTGRFRVAARILDEERLSEFEERVARWELDRVGFFGVPRAEAEAGLRAPSNAR